MVLRDCSDSGIQEQDYSDRNLRTGLPITYTVINLLKLGIFYQTTYCSLYFKFILPSNPTSNTFSILSRQSSLPILFGEAVLSIQVSITKWTLLYSLGGIVPHIHKVYVNLWEHIADTVYRNLLNGQKIIQMCYYTLFEQAKQNACICIC